LTCGAVVKLDPQIRRAASFERLMDRASRLAA